MIFYQISFNERILIKFLTISRLSIEKKVRDSVSDAPVVYSNDESEQVSNKSMRSFYFCPQPNNLLVVATTVELRPVSSH